jgi:hypothetical protein
VSKFSQFVPIITFRKIMVVLELVHFSHAFAAADTDSNGDGNQAIDSLDKLTGFSDRREILPVRGDPLSVVRKTTATDFVHVFWLLMAKKLLSHMRTMTTSIS